MSIFIAPIFSAYGQNVKPSDGALLYIFEAGTSTPKASYSDPGETVAQSHPVVADGSGRFPAIYLSGTYKAVLTDKNDVQIWEEDELKGTQEGVELLGEFDAATNGGDYPTGGQTGDLYKVTTGFVLNVASGSHQLYTGDFILCNKPNAGPIDADWDIIKGPVWIIDEDDFVSNSAILAPSQQSAKAYIVGQRVEITDEIVANIINDLVSTDTVKSLSAAQGKVLKDVQDTLVSEVAGLGVPATETTKGPGFLRKKIILSNGTDADHDIDSSAGNFIFEDGGGSASIGAFVKQIDAAWAAGSAAGGRASGVSLTNDTTYHYFALSNSDGSVVDFGFDTHVGAANLLADAAVVSALGASAKYSLIESVLTDGSANIRAFQHAGDLMLLSTPVLDFSGSSSVSATLQTLSSPLGRIVEAKLNVRGESDLVVYFSSPGVADLPPSTTVSPLGSLGGASTSHGQVNCLTNTSSQVRRRGFSVDPLKIVTYGWRKV